MRLRAARRLTRADYLSAMKAILLIPAFLAALLASAQTEVHQGTYPFSDGAHPTFMVNFENVEPGDVESWYRGQLKELSEDVTNKKELRFTGTRVAEVHPDTITVLCKAERPKKSTTTSLHLAFRSNGAWVDATTSDKKQVEAAKSYCYTKAVAYKKYLLQQQLAEAEKVLARLESEQATLVKDKGRYEEGITKNQEKGVQAGQDKLQAESDLKTNELAIESKKAEVASAPSEANTEALQKLMKDGDKLKDRIQRLGDQSVNADEKVKELEGSIKKNLGDQETKGKSIEAQRKAVEDLRTALTNVN